GLYRDGSARFQAFVVSERNGTWGTAIEVPGSGALNAGGGAMVNSVWWAAGGDWDAGGECTAGSGHAEGVGVRRRRGTWGTAIGVPGSGALNAGGDARVESVSCASAGKCAAGGFYADRLGHMQAFVVSETNGTWGTAIEVPGSGALNKDGNAIVSSV